MAVDPLVAVLGHISRFLGHHLAGTAGWRGRQTLLLMYEGVYQNIVEIAIQIRIDYRLTSHAIRS
jgi:hypothetical protein